MRHRLTLLSLAALLGTFLAIPQPAVAATAQCTVLGTMTTASPLTAVTPTATSFSVSFPTTACSDGTSTPATMTGTLTGTCTVWTAAGTSTGAWGSASFSGSVSTNPIWVYTSATFNFTLAVTGTFGGGFTCLGIGMSTWTVIGVIVNI